MTKTGLPMAPTPPAPDTVVDYRRLFRSVRGDLTLLDSRNAVDALDYRTLADSTRHAASGYRAAGLRRGDRVVLALPTGMDYIVALTGALLVGLVPCTVAPPPNPRDQDSTGHRRLRAAIAAVRPATVVAQRDLANTLRPASATVVTVDEIRGHRGISPGELGDPRPTDLHHIQLTSGSTSAPKAVALSHGAVASNIAALTAACELVEDRDRITSWLPLHHDMGFVLLLGGLVNCIPVDLMTPYAFLRDPLSWFRHMASRGGTVTAGPPFAYRMVAERQRARGDVAFDLSRVRRSFVGAEPIPHTTLRDFTTTFASSGLKSDTVVPCYGMAETVLATTLVLDSRPHAGRVTTVDLDRDELYAHGRARPAEPGREAITLVGCGRPVPGLEISIVTPDGRTCGPGEVGEIVVRGDSVMTGYLDAAGEPSPLPGGRHHTGDLGVLLDDDLYIVGRTKEMLVVRGRNIPPYDVEMTIESHPSVGAGHSLVHPRLDEDGTEHVMAVVETRAVSRDHDRVRAEIRDLVRREFGFHLTDVRFVGPGRLPRTSSGKKQRAHLTRPGT